MGKGIKLCDYWFALCAKFLHASLDTTKLSSAQLHWAWKGKWGNYMPVSLNPFRLCNVHLMMPLDVRYKHVIKNIIVRLTFIGTYALSLWQTFSKFHTPITNKLAKSANFNMSFNATIIDHSTKLLNLLPIAMPNFPNNHLMIKNIKGYF